MTAPVSVSAGGRTAMITHHVGTTLARRFRVSFHVTGATSWRDFAYAETSDDAWTIARQFVAELVPVHAVQS